MESNISLPWNRLPRKHPRVPLLTQVQSQSGGLSTLGQTENISVSGVLVLSRETLEAGSEVAVRFNLPGGRHVDARGAVRHSQPGRQMGIEFLQLQDADRKAIEEFVQGVKPYRRRSARLPRRLNVVLRWRDREGNSHEEPGETVLLSRNGGLMVAGVRFKAGETAFLWWPEGQRGAPVRIVLQQLGGHGNLAELGFEFVDVDNLWGIEFPHDLSGT